ncbi:MAG: hypothetical protein CR965_02020, partial [Paludibacter sp.]
MKRYWKIVALLLVFNCLFQSKTYSQTTIKAKTDSTQLLIGDQCNLSFEWEQNPKQRIETPFFSDTIVQFLEIVEQQKLDTTKIDDKLIKIKASYRVTSFEDTLIYVRPFPFVINKDTVWSNSLSLKVIQPFVIDSTTNQLILVQPIYSLPYDWKGLIVKIVLV